MTTIAWDGQTLAADSQRNTGNGSRTVKKISTDLGTSEWVAFAGSGEFMDIEKVRLWIKNGCDVNKSPSDVDVDGIVVHKSGEAWRVCGDKNGTNIWSIKGQIDAVGSGGNYALGAMAAGANAYDAIQIAIYYDPYSGRGTDTFVFRKNDQ